ncbi:hypothetical protein [Bradyrhizobium sp. CCBAU 53421]|uniref:hypothetical protein n=1 Tax=Bradyrhizobium sp. CCBAU 53421 TaxID=1325120 RepID=UPI001889E453|nr:hypothetical protein [Bradyrhizobium sp. CCBAU 53421]QOZ32888.1 hypothetical protein XH92_15400 [Bradyrhizobium sp. CCBAU 53421]
MPDLDTVRRDIQYMRVQVGRQRREMLTLREAGISTGSAEALLGRMLDKVDGLCAQRDRLKRDLPQARPKVLGGRSW